MIGPQRHHAACFGFAAKGRAEDLTKHPGIPDDLRRCLAIAQNHGCGVLCLDTDGPENPALKSYDW